MNTVIKFTRFVGISVSEFSGMVKKHDIFLREWLVFRIFKVYIYYANLII